MEGGVGEGFVEADVVEVGFGDELGCVEDFDRQYVREKPMTSFAVW